MQKFEESCNDLLDTVRRRPGVVTCSALKRAYRDKLAGPNVMFVHLAGTKDLVEQRLAARLNHFMSWLPARISDRRLRNSDRRLRRLIHGLRKWFRRSACRDRWRPIY